MPFKLQMKSKSTLKPNKEAKKDSDVDILSIRYVDVVVKYLKIGRIDTKNERFDAVLLIESSWEDDHLFQTINSLHESNKIFNDSIFDEIKHVVEIAKTIKYDLESHWNPSIYITNSIGDLKEEINYEIEIVKKKELKEETYTNQSDENESIFENSLSKIFKNLTVKVTEKRKIKGGFYQKLDLREFPLDIQELSVVISAQNNTEQIGFRENTLKASSVNINEFIDQQQWRLLNHVRLISKLENDHFYSIDKPFFIATAFVSRYPTYFILNVFLVLFFLSSLSFVTFSFNPWVPSFRGIVCAICLMVPVNFRWITTQLLPSVYYLTRLDAYGIGSLVIQILLMSWHGLIGSNLITNNNTEKASIDKKVFYGLAALFLLFNIVFLMNLFYLYLKRRLVERKIEKTLDDETRKYRKLLKATHNNGRKSIQMAIKSV